MSGDYSGWRLFAEALRGNTGWKPAWREPEPKPRLRRRHRRRRRPRPRHRLLPRQQHGIANVAVVEKGWLGLGNTGRNTTIVRSNYLLPGKHRFYECR